MEEALSSSALINSSNFTAGHVLEGEDSWVVIKKQIITILVPPPSPAPIQTESPRTKRIHSKSIKAAKKRSNAPGKIHRRRSKIEHGNQINRDRIEALEKTRKIHYNPPDPRNGVSSLQTPQVLRRPLVGALEATNQRLRASNLESKLERFGGLKRWLSSSGLDKFVPFFEMENLDKYQLVNLTMAKLKDMGANAVGPRRKLIHAIDSLCQPCYVKAW